MRRLFISAWKIVLGTGLIACAAHPSVKPQPKAEPVINHPLGPVQTTPTVSTAIGTQSSSHNGPWEFTYTPGSYTYAVTTVAQVTLSSDTITKRTLPTKSEQVTVTITQIGDAQVTKSSASAFDSSTICDTEAALTIHAQQLVPKLPRMLATNSTWDDSINVNSCLGSIPSQASITEKYTVLSDTTYEGSKALHIQSLESVTANGEGRIGQHRLLLTAVGKGTSDLYFDFTEGKFLGSTSTQVMKLDITTSGQTNHFMQHVTQHTALLINP